MAHELTMKNGIAEMAYAGNVKPWHGLGQNLEHGADLDQWRIAAGMDWSVESSPVSYDWLVGREQDFGGVDIVKQHPTQRVLHRSDSGLALGVVSNKYREVQPAQVLEFFRDLTEQQGFTMETAGTLFGGKKFWALASIGDKASVKDSDEVGGYVLLSTACDGTMATQARFTTVRVVCNNTLTMATQARNSQREAFIRHSSNFDAKTIKSNLGIAHDAFTAFMRSARALSEVEMGLLQAENFAESLLRDTKMVTHEDINKSPAFNGILSLFNGAGMGSSLVSSRSTAWGMVNAVTEYVDHHQKAGSASHRMQSAWFGRGEKLKSAALNKALAIAA